MRLAAVQEFYAPLDTANKGELGLSRDVEGVVALRGPLGLDDVPLGLDVLLGVLGGPLLDDLALLLVGLRKS
jgi:hypothetical protein